MRRCARTCICTCIAERKSNTQVQHSITESGVSKTAGGELCNITSSLTGRKLHVIQGINLRGLGKAASLEGRFGHQG